ncbi:MAG: hypothetical protein IPN55_15005 [Saprospiraceae bacterium]|nr:hypothetical protein [Candidatus Brachybacter algidus]
MIFLTRDDIDDVRWDGVINKSGQGLPYAYSWSLDQVAGKQWDAIISERIIHGFYHCLTTEKYVASNSIILRT